VRYAIFGDIHGNDDALEAVLKALEKEEAERFLCVGDLVGYGAEPGRCIARAREIRCVVVAGNHDYAVVERTPIDYFNPDARAAVLWTREHLSVEDKDYLESLPLAHVQEDLALVHATVDTPKLFNYIQSLSDARRSFDALERPACFVGHSHVPMTFFNGTEVTYTRDPAYEISPDVKTLVNVGSVGQPRDMDERAAYVMFDSDAQTVRLERVPYDVESAARKITDAGLPEMNAFRLRFGR